MLQSAPITAPGSTWANAQIRVPFPMEWLSTSAVSCLKYSAASTGLRTVSSSAEWHTGNVIHNSWGCLLEASLELQAQSQLQASRIVDCRDLPESWRWIG